MDGNFLGISQALILINKATAQAERYTGSLIWFKFILRAKEMRITKRGGETGLDTSTMYGASPQD